MNSSSRKKFDLALQYAEESNNRKAIDLMQELYKKYPDDINLTYNLGLCYLNMSGNPDSALFFLNKTLKLDDSNEWTEERIETTIAIARIRQLKYDFDGALKEYKKVERHDETGDWKEMIEHEREICNNAKIMMNSPVRLQVRRLGENVNCDENDYRPLVSDDMKTLIFTSRRKNNVRTQFEDGQNEERTYIATRKSLDEEWGGTEPIRNMFSSKGQETATCLRDSNLYVVRDGDIYVSHLDTAGVWSPAKPLSPAINSKSEERYACISSDGTQLFFSSNREGGFGGFDIYRSFKLPNGEWGLPLNLGANVNSEYDEDAPVLHPTKDILYFSSNGHNTMGGFDIFYAPYSPADSTFEAVVNIGYPINTPDDDLYFVPTAVKDMAYYASIKWDNSGDEFTGYDIYEVEYDEPELNKLVIFSGVVKSHEPHAVRVVAQADGEDIGRFVPNAETGKFVVVVEEGKSYTILADNGSIEKRLVVNTSVGDSYSKLGHTVVIDPFDFVEDEDAAIAAAAAKEAQAKAEALLDERKYTVQILSLREPLDYSKVNNLEPDMISEHVYRDGWYVYSFGSYDTYKEAVAAKSKVVSNTPFGDAFIRKVSQYKKFVK